MSNSIQVSGAPTTIFDGFFLTNVSEGRSLQQAVYGLNDDWKMLTTGAGIDVYQFSGTLLPEQEAEFEEKYINTYRLSKCLKSGNTLTVMYKGRSVTGYMLSLSLKTQGGLTTFSFNFVVRAKPSIEYITGKKELPKIENHSLVTGLHKSIISFNDEKDGIKSFLLVSIAKQYSERYFMSGLNTSDFKITSYGANPYSVGVMLAVPDKELSVLYDEMGVTKEDGALDQKFIDYLKLDEGRKISLTYNNSMLTGYVTESVRSLMYGENGMGVNLKMIVSKTTPMGLYSGEFQDNNIG
jgi:hypothetical protein